MKTMIRGALWLGGATLISKMIGILQKIPLQNIAGDELFGLYNAVYPFYAFLLMLFSAGLPIAVSQVLSMQRAQGEFVLAQQVWDDLRKWLWILGVLMALALAVLAAPLALAMGIAEASQSFLALSCSLFFMPLLAGMRGERQSRMRMAISAISQLVEQIVRVAIMALMLYFGFLYEWTDSFLAACIQFGTACGVFSACLLLWWQKKSESQSIEHAVHALPADRNKMVEIRRMFVHSAMIAALSALFYPGLQLVDAMTLPRIAGLEAFGIYTRPFVILQVIVMIFASLIAALIPYWVRQWSKQGLNWDPFWMAWIIGIPAMVGYVIICGPINGMFFMDRAGTAIWLILSAMIPLIGIQSAFTAMLMHLGKWNWVALLVIGGLLTKAGMNMMYFMDSNLNLNQSEWAAISCVFAYVFVSMGQFLMLLNKSSWTRNGTLFGWYLGEWIRWGIALGLMTTLVFLWVEWMGAYLGVNRWSDLVLSIGGTLIGCVSFAGVILPKLIARLNLLKEEQAE